MVDKIKLILLIITSYRLYASAPFRRRETIFNYVEIEDGNTLFTDKKNKLIFYHKLRIRNSTKLQVNKTKYYLIVNGSSFYVDRDKFPC